MAVAVALECLKFCVTATQRFKPRVDVIVAIPLPSADTMLVSHPELETIIDQPWTFGPGREVPGLYLVHDEIWRTYEALEDYRRPVAAATLGPGLAA